MSILKELKEMITARGGNAGSANTVSQAVDVLTDLSGSSGGDFIVTVMDRDVYDEETGQSYTLSEFDKTADEAIEAFNAGATVKFKHVYESEDAQGQITLEISFIITALYHDAGRGFYGFQFAFNPYESKPVSDISSYYYYYDESSGTRVFQRRL